jgi:hypothetical protein
MENKNFSVPRKQRTKFIFFHFHAEQSLLNNKTTVIVCFTAPNNKDDTTYGK